MVLLASTSVPARAQSAAENFTELCARCHGRQGLGDGPDGATLSTKPRNFHDCELMAKDSDDFVFREIKGGSGAVGRSHDMPSWGEAFEDEQIRALVAFVRELCSKK
jgi:mono/diheme cytochrome c family protein